MAFKLKPDATFPATVLIPNGDAPLPLKLKFRRKRKGIVQHRIELLVNGTTVLSTTDSSLTTGTRCGIRFSITSLRADSFAVDAA